MTGSIERFWATHVVPPSGLAAWADPDPTAGSITTLDPGLEVELAEQRPDGWARAVFANGWSCWVDGRNLQTLPWSPTDSVPVGGLPAWERPDPLTAAVTTLGAGLGVVVRERRPDGWAEVVCENRWSCFVDGRRLVPAMPLAGWVDTPSSSVWRPGAGPWALGGAALAIVGSFLPWLTAGGESVSAWKIPVMALVDETTTSDDPKIGLLLLVVALIGIPYALQRPAPRYLSVVLGSVATNLAALTFVYSLKFDPAPGIGVGLVVTLLGGGAMVYDRKLSAMRVRR